VNLINDFRDKELILALSKLIKKESVKPLNIMEILSLKFQISYFVVIQKREIGF